MKYLAEYDSLKIRRHNAAQRAYYAQRKPVRMDAIDSPYVALHFSHVVAAAGLKPGESVLEVGAGMGRFTRQFAMLGHAPVALELSPALADVCRETLRAWPKARVVTADLLDAPDLIGEQFDLVVGFFMLHHLTCHERHFEAIRRLLKPGGRCVFVEPNPWNPLYALQITLTPGMRWREEAGLYRLSAANLQRWIAAAELDGFGLSYYGFFPRWLHNLCEPIGVNPVVESLTPSGLRPFQLIIGRNPCRR